MWTLGGTGAVLVSRFCTLAQWMYSVLNPIEHNDLALLDDPVFLSASSMFFLEYNYMHLYSLAIVDFLRAMNPVV
jgi:hypothetical protein